MTQPIVHALIPARSGSKGIPHKCIRPYRGKPLMAWSIEQALACPLISQVVVSTDSPEYAEVARRYGASTPFLRPQAISGDLSTDLECFQHYLANADPVPDILVHLRPTYPNRPPGLLDHLIELFSANTDSPTALRTVVATEKSPLKMYAMDGGELIPLFQSWQGITEPFNRCRQELPEFYLHNGCVDLVRTETVLAGSMTGERIMAHVMEECFDIDTPRDWAMSESEFSEK